LPYIYFNNPDAKISKSIIFQEKILKSKGGKL
jgi:hypothetical protein